MNQNRIDKKVCHISMLEIQTRYTRLHKLFEVHLDTYFPGWRNIAAHSQLRDHFVSFHQGLSFGIAAFSGPPDFDILEFISNVNNVGEYIAKPSKNEKKETQADPFNELITRLKNCNVKNETIDVILKDIKTYIDSKK